MIAGLFLALPVFSLVAAPAVAQTDDEVDWDEFWEDVEKDLEEDTDADEAFWAGFGLLTCCFAFIPMLIWAAISYFVVYKDAQNNNVSSPGLWFAVTFFFGLLGLLLYFLVGKKSGGAEKPKEE